MKKNYKNSPIVEVIVEFQFIPSEPWDITIPGLFYEKVKSDFPKKEEQVSYIVEFKNKDGAVEPSANLKQRIKFIRSDNSALLQIWRDVLTVNHFKSYPTWKKFKLLIQKNLRTYLEIAKPKGFKRLGLRYINKIQFKERTIETKDYFRYYPEIPEKIIPKSHAGFSCRVEIPYQEERDRLILSLGTTFPDKPFKLASILDLDYIMLKPEGVSIEGFSDWLEEAHTVVEDAFEACLTERCKNLFE